MNICFISLVTFWHGVRGGMEVHGKLVTEGLARLGHQVTAVSSSNPSGAEVETHEGVTLHYLSGTTFGSQRGRWASECFERFVSLHRQRAFDVICCQQGVIPRRLLDFCRRNSVPVVVILEGHEGLMLLSEVRQTLSHGKGYGRLARQALAFAYHYAMWEFQLIRACDHVIAVSDEVARSVRRWFGVRRAQIEVVYNGIDTERFKPNLERRKAMRQTLGVEEADTLVLFFSHVTRHKGLHVLLRALPRAIDARKNVTLAVAGAGEYLAEARALADALGLSRSVAFLGEVPHERAPEYLAACDVFVLPTLRQEGLPFALLEAMACEKPVIVSRIGGVSSVVKDGVNGLLVSPGDQEALVESLERLMADERLAERLGRRARETVVSGYSVGQMVRGTADVLERMVEARRNG